MASRFRNFTDLIARFLAKEWGRPPQARNRGRSQAGRGRADYRTGNRNGHQNGSRSGNTSGNTSGHASGNRGGPARTAGHPPQTDASPGEIAAPKWRAIDMSAHVDAAARKARAQAQQSPPDEFVWEDWDGEGGGAAPLAGELTLNRVKDMLTGPMGYAVRLHDQEGHACLLGSWDDFPFVIEIPQGHEGWLLVSGDWRNPAPISQRDEVAASANDWNRDRFFPTVGVIDESMGPRVRATYMMDMSSGVTDEQLRLHLNTALSSCTQALSEVAPLLLEM